MKYEFRDNLIEKKKSENRLVWLGVIFSVMAVTFPFVGCASSQAKETLECRDNHLYSVTRQKVELMLQDSCDRGKVEMRSK